MSKPKTALVTGSARRLGRAIAAALIVEGWRVVIHSRDLARSRDACAALGAAGAVAGDLAIPEQCEQLVRDTLQITDGRLDLLVNSASTFTPVRLEAATAADWDHAFAVTARAPLLLSVATLDALRASGGTIVNILDRSITETWPPLILHGAAKAALETITTHCARMLAPDIAVYGVTPGTVIPVEGEELTSPPIDTPPEMVCTALLQVIADRARSGEILRL